MSQTGSFAGSMRFVWQDEELLELLREILDLTSSIHADTTLRPGATDGATITP
jgi:hypothetical protein